MSAAQQDPLAAVMMTLAGIAYGQQPKIGDYLAADALTAGDWRLAWIADDEAVPVNFAYIARNATTGAYAIAIRGTYPNPFSPAYWDDSNLDNPLGDMVPWPYTDDENAKTSRGTSQAFTNILALNGKDAAGQALTFTQAVSELPADTTLYVTGHSLGGTLAPVIALWASTLPAGIAATVYAFAGMTPGNKHFADLFGEGTKLDGRVWRYNNTLDTVPYGWDRILQTRDFYEPKPKGGLLVEAALAVMKVALLGYHYTSIGTEIKLEGSLIDVPDGIAIIGYVLENLAQHLPDTYLSLLGAPGLPFTLGFGAIVASNEHPTTQKLATNRMPVYFVE